MARQSPMSWSPAAVSKVILGCRPHVGTDRVRVALAKGSIADIRRVDQKRPANRISNTTVPVSARPDPTDGRRRHGTGGPSTQTLLRPTPAASHGRPERCHANGVANRTQTPLDKKTGTKLKYGTPSESGFDGGNQGLRTAPVAELTIVVNV